MLRTKKWLHIDSMTPHQFNDQASSLEFQVLFLFLRVVTEVFICLGKEGGRGGGGRKGRVLPYSSYSKIRLVHFNCLLFMPTLSCDQLINNETISSSWNMEAPYLISWQLTIHIYWSMSILPWKFDNFFVTVLPSCLYFQLHPEFTMTLPIPSFWMVYALFALF